jgi:flavin reductase (DIM6/NTAB) family NADH-FMN oxidoreductase RutF
MSGDELSGEDMSTLMAATDSAMAVVTAAAGDERTGCLVGFHVQCSIEPFRYAIWLSKANRTHDVAQRATHLAVHLLAADQHDLAELFGGRTSDEVDKLAQCDWTVGPGGTPLLAACTHRFVGRILERRPGDADGDHDLVVIDAVDASGTGPSHALRLAAADDITPGHDADERR